MNLRSFFILIALLSVASVQAQEEKQGFKIEWKNGLRVSSPDSNFILTFGGNIMFDAAFFFQDDKIETVFGELKNGVEFRRIRLFHAGEIYKKVKYKFQLDFAGGKVSFKDMYVEVVDIPGLGAIRVGQFKEPSRLENLTSSKYITFLERGLPFDFMPDRNTGLIIHNEFLKKRLGFQVAFLRNADAFGNDKAADDGYNIAARISGLPLKHDKKPRFLHVAASYSYRRPTTREFEISLTPEAHLGSDYISTGKIRNIEGMHFVGEEAALVIGPVSVQAEMMHAFISTESDSSSPANNYHFCSLYGQVSYFITGESRKYKSSYEGFDRVTPKKNLGKDGCGAWEIAARFSRSDLVDSNVNGGILNDFTFGVNWYLNPLARIMVNYGLANLKDVGYTHIAQARLQVDF